MAMSVGRKRQGAIAEINVTPMADVMIVLLIIFMVMTPIITRAPVPLPTAATAEPKGGARVEIVLSGSGEIRVGQRTLGGVEALREYIREELVGSIEGHGEVLVQADRNASYGEVSRVLDACRRAGAESVSLAADRRIGG
jgi:biopolymer transport protein ExbD